MWDEIKDKSKIVDVRSGGEIKTHGYYENSIHLDFNKLNS